MNCVRCNIIGKHVSWEKLHGKPNASMQEKTGFGVVLRLDIGFSMTIVGDYGVTTSGVKNIESTKKGLMVATENSVYLLKECH